MLFLPIGHDQSVRHFPRVTVSIIGLCLLIHVVREIRAPSETEIRQLVQDYTYVGQEVVQRCWSGAMDELKHGGEGPVDLQQCIENFSKPDGKFFADPLAGRMRELEERKDKLLARDLVQTWGYRPNSGISRNLILSGFVHGGWLHLIGNMLFFWLVGCNLEDRWGKLAFGAVYGVGLVLATATYAFWHPGSSMPVVGASGAVSAAMGAFLVCFHNAAIAYWYLLLVPMVRTGIVAVRALWALPLWFLEQLIESFAELHEATGVASSAHVGGFVAGVLIALLLKATGYEARVLLPRSAKGVEWDEEPDFVRALELVAAKKPGEAIEPLRNLVARKPSHAAAKRELCRLALELGDEALVQRYISTVLSDLAASKRLEELAENYRLLTEKFGQICPTERALAETIRCAGEMGDALLCVQATQKLMMSHPKSSFIPASMWHAAQAQEAAGRLDLAQKTLRNLVQGYPQDPLAGQARVKLEAAPVPSAGGTA